MVSDQEVRMAAAQAAASCSMTMGMSDPAGVLRVAGMWEAYINQGAEAAQRIADAWKTPQAGGGASSPAESTAPDGSGPSPDISAQELAEEAYRAETSAEVEKIIERSMELGNASDAVEIEGTRGPLHGYLDMLCRQIRDAEKKPPPPPIRNATLRADLGLVSHP